MNRYARQLILPEVGPEGQARIAAAHVLIVGAGGLGVPVLQYLAGAGVGRITLIDPDVAEEMNLHRQTIYAAHLGRPKAEAAADFARVLSPASTVHPIVARLTPANAPELVRAADIVLDCADSYAATYTLSDTCLAENRPFISASALALAGYVGGFCCGAPSLRAVFPDLPETVATCATAGILGPVVGVLGALQAQMALAIILRLSPSPLGEVISYDARALRFSSFRFDGAHEPEGPRHAFIAPEAIRPEDFVVELRPETEAPCPVVPYARRLLPEDFGPGGPLPRPGQRAVLACRSGLRAWRAADRLGAVWDGEIALVADGDSR